MTEPDEIRAARAAAFKARERIYAHWGKGLEGERLPSYRVVVRERTRHGIAGRHTFVMDPEADEPEWRRYSGRPPSGELPWEELPGERWYGVPTEPLPDVVPLAQGVDVRATTLIIIFEALVSQARHRIEVEDIHRIASDENIGGCISQLHALTAEQRRIAEPVLYTQILGFLP
jgi:hypothetical protein